MIFNMHSSIMDIIITAIYNELLTMIFLNVFSEQNILDFMNIGKATGAFLTVISL